MKPHMKRWYESRVVRKFRRDPFAMTSLFIIGLFGVVFVWSMTQDLDPFTVNKLAAKRLEAPITLVVFSNFETPVARQGARLFKQVKRRFGNKLRVVFKHFYSSNSKKTLTRMMRTAQASIAASMQGPLEFWDYHNRLIRSVDNSQAHLFQFAKDQGLDFELFKEELLLKKHQELVEDDLRLARKLGVKKAPAFFMNGMKISKPDFKLISGLVIKELKMIATLQKDQKLFLGIAAKKLKELKQKLSPSDRKKNKLYSLLKRVVRIGDLDKEMNAKIMAAGGMAISEFKSKQTQITENLQKKISLENRIERTPVSKSPIWGKTIPYLQTYNLNTGRKYAHPSWKHWLGTDRLGRDILVRTLVGVHIAFKIGIVTALIACFIGLVLGGLAGFFGGWIDIVITWIFSVLSAIPYILLLILIAAIFKESDGMIGIYVAFGIGFWIGPCRMIRGEVFKLKEMEYVQAARAIGLSPLSVLFRHVIPNTLHLVFVYFSLIFIGAVKSEVILSFLGLGVKGLPSWGRMINDSKPEILFGFWWQMIAASLALFILVYAFNILTDALQDALDPKHTR